jgi:HAD superfamily hydrolase (TIGR01509 family)
MAAFWETSFLPRYDSILFDFDGVLADTEPLHFRCWQQILIEFGVDVQWDWFAKNCVGASEHDTLQAFRGLASPPLAFEPLWAQYPRKKEMLRQLIKEGVPLAAGVRELLQELSGQYRMAVVSSSARVEVSSALEMSGILPCFDALVCGSEAGRLKPAPDPYLRAAELLQSRRPLVVEDSSAGIASAQAAGFDFIRVESIGKMADLVRGRLAQADAARLT